MNVSRPFLLGLMLLGLPAGVAPAQEPAPAPAASPAATTRDVAGAASPAPMVLPSPVLVQAPYLCDSSCPSGCNAACHGGVLGGVGLYLVQPYFDNNMAIGAQATTGAARADARIDINHHMEVAPLVWLGYMSDDGWGGRARWWYFRQDTSQSEPATPPGTTAVALISAAPLGLSLMGGAGMNVTSKLDLQVADLESLYDYTAGHWDFLLSAGVRVMHIDQAYNAFEPVAGTATLLSGHSFHGVGPTLSVEARRCLGDSGLFLYASARGSVAFGSATQSATLPDQNVNAVDHRDIGLPIGEVELGLEYGLNMGGARLFGQIALVAQDWSGAGSASRSSVNVLPGGNFVGAAYVGDSDIDFLGLSFRLGVNY